MALPSQSQGEEIRYSSVILKIVNWFRVWCAQGQRLVSQIKPFYGRGREEDF